MDGGSEAGPSASIAQHTAFMPHASIDQPGTVGTPCGQPTHSLPSITYNTSNISGGTINNVHGDFHSNPVNHYYGLSSVDASFSPASQPPLPLPPFNDAPIDRISSCFTGRESELDFITTSFNTFQSDKPTRFVIYGMPGLGKSQLALQHANLAFTAGVYSHIFCVAASTVEKLSQGLARILGLLNHADRNHPDQAVQIAAVRLWFEQSDRHGCRRWLLILDDATVESAQFLREHLPRQNAGGCILGHHSNLAILQNHKAQSVDLLLRKAGIQTSAAEELENAERLVSRMGCLPLAVEQAGSYMKRSGLKNAHQMQRMYDERGLKDVISWQNNLTTYEQTSILAAFTLQFQKLDEIDPDAHRFLKTLAFFDPENIPIDILSLGARSIRDRLAKDAEHSLDISPASAPKAPVIRRLLEKLEKKQRPAPVLDIPAATPDPTDPLEGVPAELRGLIELICSEERVRAALHHFEDLSIAQPLYTDKPSLHIHDLIQCVLRQSTRVHHEEGYHALAVVLLCHAFMTIDEPDKPQSWAECERFVPHFTALGAQDKAHPASTEKLMDTNPLIARYFFSRGRYKEAETLLNRVLAHRKRLLGLADLRTTNSMQCLAVMRYRLGRYQEAEALFVQALAAEENQLGPDHLATLTTMHKLAVVYKAQGRYDEAEGLYAQALAGREKQLDPDHLTTMSTLRSIADLYVCQGRLDEAESLYGRALAGSEKQLCADHPDVLTTVHNLGRLYKSQGRFDEAESFYTRALAGREKQLGVHHPDVLTTVHNLGRLYKSQGKFDEAESCYTRALAGWEKQLGVDHPDVLTAVHNLGRLYKCQGKFDEAESFSMSDPLLSPPPAPPHTDTTLTPLDTLPTPPAALAADPPPPYPSSRRTRTPRRARARVLLAGHSTDSEPDAYPRSPTSDREDYTAMGETTPLLSPGGRPRRSSLSRNSILSHASSAAPSLAHTVASLFHPDADDEDEGSQSSADEGDRASNASPALHLHSSRPRRAHAQVQTSTSHEPSESERERRRWRWRRYFRPMARKVYWWALFHLLVLNFPFALAAWIYLFVFTLTGTTLMIVLPLGALLCFLDLLGGRAFARGELALQTTFHRPPPSCPVPYPPRPIFTRPRAHTPADANIESGAGTLGAYEGSFYKNAYAMFADPTSYQALFYFLVIKPPIVLILLLALLVLAPVCIVLVLPAPAFLRAVRRVGAWQAGVAVEGLWCAVR
ncbi:TPR-like protein [Athelia psychrophila]|uniref:TPR-like protein n=1 Tax=Athelia psychrophila TaxID=1759441 RepID=A0A166PVL1_9AGAM|nr:TPR-like protein [Fibularhizoctonia sp. CBS 109695]